MPVPAVLASGAAELSTDEPVVIPPAGREAVPEPQVGAAAGIRLQEVTKRFGRVEAVAGITLDVGPGELVTLLGPSGSGKTSTLMMVAGHETPDSGAVVIGGEDVTRLPAHRRNIGMVFQQFALFPHFSVAENVAFPLRMRRRPY